MIIKIKKLGGFAGIDQMLASFETDRMPKASADQVLKHVEELAIFLQKPESVGADQFRYQIEITEPGRALRTITVADEGDPNHPTMKHVASILALAGARQS